jgi:glycosyltransferase involved in cell wall biosynthesis
MLQISPFKLKTAHSSLLYPHQASSMPIINTVPTLKDLPPPPLGKTGWPWTEESQLLPERMPDGCEWPQISIVTPNYNYGQFLEETIRSVLLQGYPNLEYIILDGGSTDNSVEIIKKYQDWLTYWVSEKDNGQPDAINKGIALSSGEIFNWLNSDDQFLPGVLSEVSKAWHENHPHLIVGETLIVDASSRDVLYHSRPKPPKYPFHIIKQGMLGVGMSQPSSFISLSLIKDMGGVSEDLHYTFDWALYLKVITLLRSSLKVVTAPIIYSRCLRHLDAKTFDMCLYSQESQSVLKEMLENFIWHEKLQIKWHIKEIDIQKNVNEVIKADQRPLKPLLHILRQHPDALFSRFFLGALKREGAKAIFH